MKAIYKGKLYILGDQLTVAVLLDEAGEELTVSLGDPDLIVDPTDSEIEDNVQ